MKHILVVDDLEEIQELWRLLGERNAHRWSIDVAPNGTIAVQMAGSKEYSLVITDIQMENDRQGLEVLKQLNGRPLCILMTGIYKDEEIAQMIEEVRPTAIEYPTGDKGIMVMLKGKAFAYARFLETILEDAPIPDGWDENVIVFKAY